MGEIVTGHIWEVFASMKTIGLSTLTVLRFVEKQQVPDHFEVRLVEYDVFECAIPNAWVSTTARTFEFLLEDFIPLV
jgi:hypothetical protein